ncbi:MAG: hypothetical protein CM1200mP32_05340 [Methanobacteriota archaeon]|nr:MAG: hypothetical protein CM1200mP32_05340 [Euryarchaeota archaeon]
MIDPSTIIRARREMTASHPRFERNEEDAAEGGCGVVGLACEVPVAGRHLFDSLEQMRNRGNGKGGGVAMVGLDANQFGVDETILANSYLYSVAYLNSAVRDAVEESFIHSNFHVDHIHEMPALATWKEDLPSLETRPPDVVCYFLRPRESSLDEFVSTKLQEIIDPKDMEAATQEFVFHVTHSLNVEFYAKDGRTDAFVLSHGRDLLILKIVGYAEDVIRYYSLEDMPCSRLDWPPSLPDSREGHPSRGGSPLRTGHRLRAGTQRRFLELCLGQGLPCPERDGAAVLHRHRGRRAGIRLTSTGLRIQYGACHREPRPDQRTRLRHAT